VPWITNGHACSFPDQCASGFCPTYDAICCDKACTGGCESCKQADTGNDDGTCDFVASGGDPKGNCPLTTPGPGGCGSSGDGCVGTADACFLWDNTTECVAESCTGSTDTPARMCDGSGTCQSSSPGPCAGGYTCGLTSCRASCTNNAQCVATSHCNTSSSPGVCEGDHDPGNFPCLSGADCKNGFCVDGFCCNSACNFQCEACSTAKTGSPNTNGTCAAVAAGTDPDNECADAAGNCGPNGNGCNGVFANLACNFTAQCACTEQYPTGYGVKQVCVAAMTYCTLEVTTTTNSCDEICKHDGGECLVVFDNNPDNSCTVDNGNPRNCSDKGASGTASVICRCSRGCGDGPACIAPWQCVNGGCQ